MKTSTLELRMSTEPVGLERLLGVMRRRCVPLHGVTVRLDDQAYLVSLTVERKLEPTALALLTRVPEVTEVIELEASGFWAQFGMTGV